MSAKQSTGKSQLGNKIIETAWKQIAGLGASSLSLRAIARELGVTAPAIYNYFPRRDDLVTALIVEAFQSFGAALHNALTELSADAHKRRIRALGIAYREWAVEHPQHYQLIFGTPIPGYVAPEEITGPAAADALSILVQVLHDAQESGTLSTHFLAPMDTRVKAMLTQWRESRAEGVQLDVLYLAHIIWSRAHGLVSLEIGQQFPAFIDAPEALYMRDLDGLLNLLFS